MEIHYLKREFKPLIPGKYNPSIYLIKITRQTRNHLSIFISKFLKNRKSPLYKCRSNIHPIISNTFYTFNYLLAIRSPTGPKI